MCLCASGAIINSDDDIESSQVAATSIVSLNCLLSSGAIATQVPSLEVYGWPCLLHNGCVLWLDCDAMSIAPGVIPIGE